MFVFFSLVLPGKSKIALMAMEGESPKAVGKLNRKKWRKRLGKNSDRSTKARE